PGSAPHGAAGRDHVGVSGYLVRGDPAVRDGLRAHLFSSAPGRAHVMGADIDTWSVPIAVLGGAIRVSTPFLFVSLGECLTEKSGRINLGLEGTLVAGAITGYATAYQFNSAWIGVLAAGFAGCLFGALHGYLCSFQRVNDIAIGIALMLLGTGLAFFFGKP